MIRGKRSPINPIGIFPESDEWAIDIGGCGTSIAKKKIPFIIIQVFFFEDLIYI